MTFHSSSNPQDPSNSDEHESDQLLTAHPSHTLDAPVRRILVRSQRTSSVPPQQPAGVVSRQPSTLSLAMLLETPFVHRRLILTSLVIAGIVGWLAILILPRSYYSEAKLMVRVGRESIALDPTATTSQTLMLQKTQEEEINSVVEVLSSRQLAEQVVAKLGADVILDGYLPGKGTGEEKSFLAAKLTSLKNGTRDLLSDALIGVGIKDDISDHELAVMELQDNLYIESPRKSTVVSIRSETKSPELAQAIVASLIEDFLTEHVRVSTTKGSQEFFLQQAAESELQLNDLLDERSELLQHEKIASIESQQATLTARLAEIDRDLLVARSSLEQYEAEIADLLEKAADTPDEIVAAKQKESDSTWSSMRNRLYELEMQEKELDSKYSSDHPKLSQVREQLAGARAILEKVESERENQSMTPNPARLRIEEDIQRKQTSVVGLRSLITERELQRGETQKSIHELLNFELRLAQLDREIGIGESSLRLLRDKQEEARVIDELRAKQISNISVFQPASFVERAFSPKKKFLAAGFGMLGLFAGLGLALVRELNSNTIRRPDQITSIDSSLPLLASLPLTPELSNSSAVRQLAAESQMRNICSEILSEIMMTRPLNFSRHGNVRAIGIMGIERGCGASTLAAALAMTASENAGLRTTLIDADLRQRTTSTTFGLNGTPGLAELLAGEANTETCLQQRDSHALSVISCSNSGHGGTAIPSSYALADTLVEIGLDNDLILIDLPPANRADQSSWLANQLDHVVIVTESERTDLGSLQRLHRRLEENGTQVIGVVLNKYRNHLPQVISRLFLS